jgi:hypothetical protein
MKPSLNQKAFLNTRKPLNVLFHFRAFFRRAVGGGKEFKVSVSKFKKNLYITIELACFCVKNFSFSVYFKGIPVVSLKFGILLYVWYHSKA